MTTPRSFRVIILSGSAPQDVARIVLRIHKEVPEAEICGVLYERRPHKTFLKRYLSWTQISRGRLDLTFAISAIPRSLSKVLRAIVSLLLRFAHACPANPNGSTKFDLEELSNFCEVMGCSLFVTDDMDPTESLEFVRRLQPELGILYGTRIPRPKIFEIPAKGSINIHPLPDDRGGGPIGLRELLEKQKEIRIAVHHVAERLDEGVITHATTIPIETYDNLKSLDLKARVVANDLLVRAVADFARGTVQEKPQEGPTCLYRNPDPRDMRRYERELSLQRPVFRAPRRRPVWNLLLRTLFWVPIVVVRNWICRLRGRFPIAILCSHLITDRPHYMGMPTGFFFKRVDFLRRYYRIVSLSEAVELLESGRVKVPTVVLTFDDGYRENFVSLRAVTEQAGIPAALFVCTQHVTSQEEFQHDLNRGQAGFLPLTWEQLTHLSQNGFEIGSHTRSHFNCGSSDAQALRSEIVGSKIDLEQHLGSPVKFFAFPWGIPHRMSPQAIELARRAYPYVLSAHGGVNFPSSKRHLWHLNRCGHPLHLWELELRLQSILWL